MTEWLFQNPPNLAVLTTRSVVHDGAWIALVTHDGDDGGWQFHGGGPGPARIEDAMVVSLREMIVRDPTLNELADLPEGWRAWREGPVEPWYRGVSNAP